MAEKKKGGFWSDFKAFITRGNVIDMAVGVVIGGAFGKIVTGLVNYILNPIIGLITGGVDLDNVKTVLVAEEKAIEDGVEVVTQPEVALMWGLWIQTIIDFVLVALFIFLMLRIMMKASKAAHAKELAEKAKAEEEAAAKAAEEKKAADAAAAEAAAQAAARQKALEDSLLNQEKLLAEICDTLKKK
ncbi:MAG: large conductance mechanosensitive channel protein MscL [Clostridia bacterium]|nr:large conductance mechanosensitive channel protein MscL [Clostridia bacterium]